VHGQYVSQKPELIVETYHLIAEVVFRRRHHEAAEAIVLNEAMAILAGDDML
jgi:hypothetical protein